MSALRLSEQVGHADLGTMALEEGGRVDFARLRRERQGRLLAEMDRRGIDVLLLGREANARYAAGARRLWTAGTRPFGPGCVVVGATGDVHLLSLTDEGIPPELPFEHLFALSWNPATIVSRLAAIPGVSTARVIGVDGMSPLLEALLRAALPATELVPADAAMSAVRRIKTPEEVACIRTAVAIAEASMAAVAAAIRAGVGERELAGVFAERAASLGVTTPAMQGTFCVTPRGRTGAGDGNSDGGLALRQLCDDRAIRRGDLVACSSGVLYAGYEGSLARTYPCGRPRSTQKKAYRWWRTALERVLAEIRPGRTGADLGAAYASCGDAVSQPPVVEIAHGVGLGSEPPLVGILGAEADARVRLEAGMVLGVQICARVERAGGYLGKEVVLVGDDGPVVLTRLGHGPLADQDDE